jgi:hypothetical protein
MRSTLAKRLDVIDRLLLAATDPTAVAPIGELCGELLNGEWNVCRVMLASVSLSDCRLHQITVSRHPAALILTYPVAVRCSPCCHDCGSL